MAVMWNNTVEMVDTAARRGVGDNYRIVKTVFKPMTNRRLAMATIIWSRCFF
jgi:hypothetical protein